MSSRLTRYFQVLCCLDTPDGGSSRPLSSRSDIHACRGAPSIEEAERADCPQHPVYRVVECPHSSPPPRRKTEDRLTPVPPVTIADCSPYHDVSSPSRGENERAGHPQLPVFRTFPSPFSSRMPLRLAPSTNRQYNQSSPPPRREAEDQLTPVPLATTTDRPPYHDAPSPSRREIEQIDHSQHPVFQTFPDPSSSRAPFPISNINRQYNPSLLPPQKKVDGPAGEAGKRMDEIAKTPSLTAVGEIFTTSHNPTRGEIAILEFVNSNLTPERSRQRVASLLESKELLRDVQGLTPEGRAKFMDKIDEAYPTIDSQTTKFVTALGNVCSVTEQLPHSAVLSVGLEKRGNTPVASGGLTDVWRGEYGGMQVGIKAFRIHPAQGLKEAKEILRKRVPTWRRLSHENILPFRGVNMTLFQLALVYDWGQRGNINRYISSHPSASRPNLLFDVVKGLEYLHSLDIPHGDLKGANVIVDRRGRARLTEYGLAPINLCPSFTIGATPETVGTPRCLAPEIINPSCKANDTLMESKPADIFAFAMFSVEVFTGKIPFEKQENEAVAFLILEGSRPEMPENAQAVGLTSEMWEIIEACWQQDPVERPTTDEVTRRWQKFIEYGDYMVTECV